MSNKKNLDSSERSEERVDDKGAVMLEDVYIGMN